MKKFIALFLIVNALSIFAGGSRESEDEDSKVETEEDNTLDSWSNVRGREVEMEETMLYIEYNFTDQDLYVHGMFDDEGWELLNVYTPDGELLLSVSPQSGLKDLCMAGIFFESREPPTSEFSFSDLKANFPQGEYAVRGITFKGDIYIGSALFSHDLPVPPQITAPVLVEDEKDTEDAIVAIDNLVVRWEDVTKTVDGMPVIITAYEVIITKEEHEDPHGFSRPVFDVHVPADHLPYIFDRFYCVESSRASSGTGLGLAIALDVAKVHGGSIKVTSEIGAGTTFIVKLLKSNKNNQI